VHGVDAAGQVVIRRQLKRRYVLAFFEKLSPCLVGIEACASSHYWSRELQAIGHSVRLMPPAYVKPYVKRQKNDIADAEAICEAVTRSNMRFVPTKTPEQQSGLMVHRTRHLLIRQRTSVINAIRAHLPNLALLRGSGAGVSRNCCVSLPIRAINGCLSLCAPALRLWAANYSASKSRSCNLIE
jgi:transposase